MRACRSVAVHLLAGGLLAAAACASPSPSDPVARPGPTVGTVAPVTATLPTTTTTAAPVTTAAAVDPDQALLASIVVAPEQQGGYDRDRFHHWIDADHDGCNTRCEVLESERRPDVGWVSIYDGLVTRDKAQLEIDHVVALAEAWRSGAAQWDDAQREAFANDLDEPDALIAVSSASNQSKSDKDPAEWHPPSRGSWCQWARGWAKVKAKWSLTADATEMAALHAVLDAC